MAASNDARRFFDAIARRYDRVYALSGPSSRERIARVIGEIAGRTRVLVLGLGTGRELPALLDAGHEPLGVDISSEMIALCNKRSRTVPTLLADFWQPLSIPDASFDAVIALHGTLAHPPDEAALENLGREVARVLVPSGILVAEVPRADALARIAGERSDEGISVTMTGPTTFVHRDDVAGVELEGIALDAEGWRRALGASLDLRVDRVEPLGVAEYMIVARSVRS